MLSFAITQLICEKEEEIDLRRQKKDQPLICEVSLNKMFCSH